MSVSDMDRALKTPLSQEFRKLLDESDGILGVHAKTGILHPIEQDGFKVHAALNSTRVIAMVVLRGSPIFMKPISLSIYVRSGVLSNTGVQDDVDDDHNNANLGA